MKRFIFTFLLALVAVTSQAQTFRSPYVVSKILSVMRQPPSDLVLLSAHRMSWQNYPENSIDAFRDTILNKQIETIEIDARLSSDGVVVISHDYKIDRVSDGTGFLYQKTWAQLQSLRLRDRLGNIYFDSQGLPARFMNFQQVLLALQAYSTTTNGYVVIVDVKGAADAQDPTSPMAVLLACIDQLRQAAASGMYPAVIQGIVFKLKGKDLPTDRTQFEALTQWHTAADGGLIVVLNPDDATAAQAGYNPAADAFFQRWLATPYLVHFEMNQYYLGDGLQPYIDYLANHTGGTQVGFATYYEPYYFPEGVANSEGKCCFAHVTDPATPRTPHNERDYRAIPEMSILPATALVTTDGTDELNELLKARGRRNLNRIK